ncbi:MAG: alanyl-tRNA editing protein [Desulfuromonas sp.]|nr:MAG: alanyl-tRNA editing protein [Desulfuromonas sp.]
MTVKLFWDDPYRTTLDTVVTAVAEDCVSLRETIFYAFSGGQESDAGTINGLEVLEARKQGYDILYRLPEGHGLEVGTPVTVAIDWPRRYRLMRLHFAAELILELVYRRFPGIEKIGAHIGEQKARLDFLLDSSIKPHFPTLLADAEALIAADQPVVSDYSDPETQRRYWEVPGFARVSCGGTHLKSTGEVGGITLKRKNIGGGKERIEISLTTESGLNSPA